MSISPVARLRLERRRHELSESLARNPDGEHAAAERVELSQVEAQLAEICATIASHAAHERAARARDDVDLAGEKGPEE